MNIMTKRGQLDNVVTYEHICDTVADMANINPSYVTLGSVCIVIKGENDDLEVYMADSGKEWKIISSSSDESGSISSSGIHICAQDEYDSVTGMPTIEDPLSNTFYLTPGGSETNDLYNEWIWLENDEEWEKFGSATTAISQPDWNQSDSSADDFIKNKPAIGDLANLTTSAKNNLVAAINEAAQSGGGSTGGVMFITGTIDFSDSENPVVTLEKTFDEICEAITNGVYCVMLLKDMVNGKLMSYDSYNFNNASVDIFNIGKFTEVVFKSISVASGDGVYSANIAVDEWGANYFTFQYPSA